MTSLQRETVISELTKVALRLDRLTKRRSVSSKVRINAAIRLSRIRAVLKDL